MPDHKIENKKCKKFRIWDFTIFIADTISTASVRPVNPAGQCTPHCPLHPSLCRVLLQSRLINSTHITHHCRLRPYHGYAFLNTWSFQQRPFHCLVLHESRWVNSTHITHHCQLCLYYCQERLLYRTGWLRIFTQMYEAFGNARNIVWCAYIRLVISMHLIYIYFYASLSATPVPLSCTPTLQNR